MDESISGLFPCRLSLCSSGAGTIPFRALQVAQWVKNPPAMQETQEMWVPALDQEDPLEESMVTHSSILAWRSPWTEEPGGLLSIGLQRVRHN